MEIGFQLWPIWPEVILVLGLLVSAFAVFLPRIQSQAFAIPLITLGVAAAFIFRDFAADGTFFRGLFVRSAFLDLAKLLILVSSALAIVLFRFYSDQTDQNRVYPLLLAAVWGSMLMISTRFFPLFLVGFETLSLSGYVLTAWNRDSKGIEAAVKYFFLGALSTAILLLGIALLFGVNGNLAFGQQLLPAQTLPAYHLQLIGGLLVIIGLAFKVAAAPFHFWAADVYYGSTTAIGAFLITVPKIALFIAFHQFFFTPFIVQPWVYVAVILGVVSLLVGNALALAQKDVKKMLAFSSVAHSGLLLLLVPLQGITADMSLLYYLAAYGFASLGIFSIILELSKGQPSLQISDLQGLYHQRPYLALVFAFFLLGLAGIPLTPGFFSKFFLLLEVTKRGGALLAIFGLLASAVGAVYYIKVVGSFFKKAEEHSFRFTPLLQENQPGGVFIQTVTSLAFLLLIALTIWPNFFYPFLQF